MRLRELRDKKAQSMYVEGSESNGHVSERPTSIADRMSLLEGAQKTWHKRVGEKDVKQFTVHGKMSMAGVFLV